MSTTIQNPVFGGGGAPGDVSVEGLATVENISGLKGTAIDDLDAGTVIDTLGYGAAGDNGAGRYELRDSSATADDFLVIAPNTLPTGKENFRWHLILRRPRRFLMAQAGADVTGQTAVDTVLQRLFDASHDTGRTIWDGQGGTYFVNDNNLRLTLSKNLKIVNAKFVGDSAKTPTTKSLDSVFVLHSDLTVKNVDAEHFGALWDAGKMGVVGESKDNAKIRFNRGHYEDCNFFVNALGGGTSDGSLVDEFGERNYNTISRLEFQNITGERVIRPFNSRIKKYGDIYFRNVHFKDCDDDENFLGYDPILSSNHVAIRIGQDHGGTSEDDEHFKTVRSAVFQNVTLDGVSFTAANQVYGCNMYIHDVRFISYTVSNLRQNDGETEFTKPVSGVYFRGRNWSCRGGYFRNCSHGSGNGMLHSKSAGVGGSAIDNHFEITQDYLDIKEGMTPIGITAEKAGTYNENRFSNVHTTILAQDDSSSRRTFDISRNVARVSLDSVTVCQILLGGRVSVLCSHNQFPDGGRIVQLEETTEDMRVSRILYNVMRTAPGVNITSQIDVQRSPNELQEIAHNTIIQENETGTDRIRVSSTLAGTTLKINDNYIKHPDDVGTWGSFFDAIYVTPGTLGRLCQIYRNQIINVKGRGIRYRGAFDYLDIEDPYIEGAGNDKLRFDDATMGYARIVSRSGDFQTMNKGVVSVTTASTSVSHGVDAIDEDDRDPIESGEVELRVIGDISPATLARAVKTSASAFSIELNDTPAAAADIAWIAKRTDQFDDYHVYTTPLAPTNLAATAGNGEVDLTWDKSAHRVIDNHHVYRNTVDDFGTATKVGANLADDAESYKDTTVDNGTEYFYWVVAENENGEGSPSNVASATPTA